MSLGDLMMPDRVKFHYRKAMLVLHPDKNVNGSAEQRFISEKVHSAHLRWIELASLSFLHPSKPQNFHQVAHGSRT